MSASQNFLLAGWARLQPRERFAVLAAVTSAIAAAIWLLLIQPAWRVLSTSAQQHAQIDAQLVTMQTLAAQAQALRALPSVSTDESLRLLDGLVKSQLGTASGLASTGDQALVTLKSVSANNLLSFLQAARVQARAVPATVNLQRSIATGTSTAVLWDGRIALTLHASP